MGHQQDRRDGVAGRRLASSPGSVTKAPATSKNVDFMAASCENDSPPLQEPRTPGEVRQSQVPRRPRDLLFRGNTSGRPLR